MLKKAFWVVFVMTQLLLQGHVLAFHPDEFSSDAALQCIVCNASQYCKNGVRYACPGNSTAIQYADILEECICNPGYEQVWRGLPMTWDFGQHCQSCTKGTNFGMVPPHIPSDYDSVNAYRRDSWKAYAISIGATTNANNRDGRGLNKAGDPPNRIWIDIPLSPQHTKVVVYYSAVQSEHLNLYIDNVYKQTCYDNRRVGTCYFETFYTPGQVLSIRDESPYGWVFLGENLYFHFTNPNPTWSCNLGLLPHWYLYGQKNSCPATKGVAAHGSGTVEDCVCLPGYASQGPGVYTACLPCPAGTFADKHNSSQCTPCPANSSHTNTMQTSISACLCNAGWAGVAASGCVECAAGSFSPVNGSTVCQVCRNNSDTYELYPRTECQCHKGYFNAVTQNMLSSSVINLRDQAYHLLIATTPVWGWTSAGSLPTYFAQGGYYNNAFLRFSKTSATSGHNYIGPAYGSVGFTNGITIVFVVRLQSTLTNSGGMDASFVSFQRSDEHHALSLNLRMIGGILHMCLSTYSGETCARADAPLETWIKFSYTYHPSASPRGNVRVEYTSSSGAVIVWTATNNKVESDFSTRKIAFGTSVSNNCAGYYSFIQLYENAACDRPNFDTAGFYFIPALASNSDINAIYRAIANGVHLKDLPLQDSCKQCNTNSFKDYIGNLRASDTVCPSCDPNARSPVQSVSILACLCQGGFFDNGNHTCQACVRNQYKETASNNSQDLEFCKTCPDNTVSKVSSPNILDCVCLPGYTGPNGGPCVQCPLGKYKGSNGTSSCIDCPLHTWADETNMTACKSCKELLKSTGGETESTAQNSSESCFCRPGYITNGTNGTNGTRSCAPCAPGNYSLVKNLAECTACPQHTYTDPVLFPWDLTSDCRVCKLCNASTNVAFTDHYDAARGGVGCGEASVEVCTQCPSGSSLFLPTNESQRNFGVRSCVCDVHFYGIVGTACVACPSNQVRPFFIYANSSLQDCLCAPGFEPDPAAANLCRQCPIGTYKPELGDHNCSVCPETFTTEVTGNSQFSACVCRPGYALSADQVCVICPENTQKSGFNMLQNCTACTSNSFGAAGGTGPMECSCSASFEANPLSCTLCKAGKYKNESTKIAISNELFVASQTINLARACSGGNCPTLMQSWWGGEARYHSSMIVDGDLSLYNTFHSAEATNPWVAVDLQQSMYINRVRIYNRAQCCWERLYNFEIRIGNNAPHSDANPVCVQNQPTFVDFKDFTCVMSGRYVALRVIAQNIILNIREIEVYGTKLEYSYQGTNEWKADVVSTGTVLGRCSACPQNTFTNNTGVLACDACAVGKTTDGRTGQVECVCDVGTLPGADGVCQLCPVGSFKATTTDKYTNRACVNCSSCGANQQVNTECNSTLDVKCRACQANSWSSAGRTLLEPCLCNAGYELQGELCVACSVGKARQADNNNSIVCETCNSTTFTSVSKTVSCGACSAICGILCNEITYDFSPYKGMGAWTNYAAGIGATTFFDSYGYDAYFKSGNQAGYIQLTLPGKSTDLYNDVKVKYNNPFWQGGVGVLINNVLKQSIGPGGSAEYVMQTYSSGTILKIEEYDGMIGENLKITMKRCLQTYVQQECNASRDVICPECQKCKPGFYANNTCSANYNNNRLDTQCVSCPENAFCPGTTTFQQFLLCSEQRCGANQQVETLCNATHTVTCRACQANSWSYAGRTLLDPCFCNAGYELQGELCVACSVGKARQANANNSIVCEECAVGTFTLVSTTINCQSCSSVCSEYSTRNAGTAGQCVDRGPTLQFFFRTDESPYSWQEAYNEAVQAGRRLPTIAELRAYIISNPSAFTQFDTLDRWTPVVNPAVANTKDFVQIGTFDWVHAGVRYYRGMSLVQLRGWPWWADGYHEDYMKIYIEVLSTTTPVSCYVLQECNASRDVICQECQTCGPGFFANNTCGANYSNDRLDTQCVLCPAGSYCPGGNVSQLAIVCPDNGKSPAGSDDQKACDCDPGYFRDVDGCSLCHFDFYCLGKQIQHAIACPPDSRTARRGSTSRLDCHCHTGYFRDPPERLDSFNCSLCLPGDFCFNNSAYNCSDALMVSAPGSGFFDNCTCVAAYYNNGTVCEDCPANYYCEGGQRLSCPANEWTAYEGRSYECVCMPGFYRDQDSCVPCTNNYFCDGLDDSRQACPSNSVSNSAVGIQDCLCDVRYEAIFSSNVSEPHFCQLCAHTYTFKGTVGNSMCVQCTQCLPQQHSAWTQIECTTRADALCDTCTVCHNASLGIPRSQYTTQACEQFFDTECGNCSACNWENEFELTPCSETEDATCSPITFQRQCSVGFYAGGHTHTSDSQCLPCAVRNTPYEGLWLHEFTSAGEEYNNRYSCEMQCRPFSRLVNNSDTSFGCTTCETGNVLFKIFTQDMFACRFECLEGYVSINGDCVLDATEGNELTFWNHSLNVTHVRREEQHNNSGSGAFLVTVSHTSHGHFAVVVGPTEPSCTGLSQATLTKTALSACCFDALWRVSSTNQLGLPTAGSESCSRKNAPWSMRLGETQLQFEIPDTRMQDLGSCDLYGELLSCVVQVSIVDIILLRHFSVPLRLEISRSSALAITSTETYVPLSSIRVEAQLAYKEEDGSPVFVVVTDMAPLDGAGITEVLLFGTGLVLVQPASNINCARFALGNVSNVSTDAWTLKTNYVRATTFLRATDKTTVFIKLFYTLRLRERETTAVKNTMHIAVWRNISTTHTVCDDEVQPTVVRTGQVLSCSGLGESAVAAATALSHATDTVHGEVGGLTSFVARALHAHVRTVHAVNMLLAFTLPPVAIHTNITRMRMGTLEFTEEFRATCSATPFCHFRYAHQSDGMHFMRSCDNASQNAARTWLRLALGVVYDDGHVMQLCRLAQWQQGHEYAFLITLVNTRAYLPQATQWHDLQNRSASVSTSNVFALFEFV